MIQQDLYERLKKNFSGRLPKVAFPEDLDSRIHSAVKIFIEQGLMDRFVVFSKKDNFLNSLGKENKDFFSENNNHLDFSFLSDTLTQSVFDSLCHKQSLKNKIIDENDLLKKSQSSLYQAVYLLSQKKVDCVIAGCSYTTKEVIRAGLDLLEKKSGITTVSSSFLMDRKGLGNLEPFRALFADCGVVMRPTARYLVDIAEASLDTWRSFNFLFPGEEPVVSFLSFASHTSALDQSVKKVREAYELFCERNPEVICDGPLQFDAAFDLMVRNKKTPRSSLDSKKVNLYIFPDLNSGNIAYKVAQRLGHCDSYGPLLQGFQGPYSDLSRGACVSDITMTTCLKLLSLSP